MATISNTMMTDAALALEALELAAERCATAHNRVSELEDDRALVKAACIKAMIGTENAATGKPHSASSAEAVVESWPEYQRHRAAQREAEVERRRSLGQWHAAQLKARLASAIADG
jgi:hypothetical protein